MTKIIDFLRDVKIELAKVTWPTRQETMRYTMIVVGAGIGMAIFLGAWDFLFEWLLKHFIIK